MSFTYIFRRNVSRSACSIGTFPYICITHKGQVTQFLTLECPVERAGCPEGDVGSKAAITFQIRFICSITSIMLNRRRIIKQLAHLSPLTTGYPCHVAGQWSHDLRTAQAFGHQTPHIAAMSLQSMCYEWILGVNKQQLYGFGYQPRVLRALNAVKCN